jgi:hypothetical protein
MFCSIFYSYLRNEFNSLKNKGEADTDNHSDLAIAENKT